MSESSDDIRLINAKVEPAIADLSSSVPYPVKSGAGSILWNKLSANTVTPTNIVFNVNLNPQFIIDREMRLRTQMSVNVRINKGTEPDGDPIKFKFGDTDALRPFPLNQTIQQNTFSIGGQTITLAQRDIFDLLLKCTPKKFLSRYNSTCPSYIDSSYKNYKKRPQGSLNDPLQGYEDALLSDMVPNGAFPITVIGLQQYTSSNVAVGDAGEMEWETNASYATAKVEFETDEPLFISPLIFTGDMNQNKSGIVGVNNFEIQLGLTGVANHMFCASEGGKEYSDLSISKAELHYKTYTASNADTIPIKSVIPYKIINKAVSAPLSGSVPVGGSGNIISQNVYSGFVPDHFIVAVRKRRSDQTLFDASSCFFPITNINVSYNNTSNLLSSLTQEDLWRLSVKNGSTQSFYEFRGKANVGTINESNSGVLNNYAATIGSLLVISTTDLNILPTLAPGTMTNIQFNFNVNFTNNDTEVVSPELVVMYVSDGILTIMNGIGQISNTLLTESGNAKVLSEAPVKVIPELMYVKRTERSGGNLSGLLASKIQKALSGKSGSGVKSGAGVISGGSSLFY